jgi:hypothetical protein
MRCRAFSWCLRAAQEQRTEDVPQREAAVTLGRKLGKDRCPGGMQKRKNQDASASVRWSHRVARLSKERDRERGGIGGETAGDVPCPTSLLRVVYSQQEPPCQRDRFTAPTEGNDLCARPFTASRHCPRSLSASECKASARPSTLSSPQLVRHTCFTERRS